MTCAGHSPFAGGAASFLPSPFFFSSPPFFLSLPPPLLSPSFFFFSSASFLAFSSASLLAFSAASFLAFSAASSTFFTCAVGSADAPAARASNAHAVLQLAEGTASQRQAIGSLAKRRTFLASSSGLGGAGFGAAAAGGAGGAGSWMLRVRSGSPQLCSQAQAPHLGNQIWPDWKGLCVSAEARQGQKAPLTQHHEADHEAEKGQELHARAAAHARGGLRRVPQGWRRGVGGSEGGAAAGQPEKTETHAGMVRGWGQAMRACSWEDEDTVNIHTPHQALGGIAPHRQAPVVLGGGRPRLSLWAVQSQPGPHTSHITRGMSRCS